MAIVHMMMIPIVLTAFVIKVRKCSFSLIYKWNSLSHLFLSFVGYTGSDCSQTVSTTTKLNYSPALLGLIITLFIIVVILGASIAYMVRQMNAYKQDLMNYSILKGQEEENAVV
jgi:L-lactate permease